MALEIGQRVKFRTSHQKELELTGTIESVSGDSVAVMADEANGSVSRVYVAHAADVTAIESEGSDASEKKEAQDDAETEEESSALETDGEIRAQEAQGESSASSKVTHMRHKRRG